MSKDTPTKDLSVAIVGGGMGGLAAGVALGRAGIKVDLFEQAPKFEVGLPLELWRAMLTHGGNRK
jgi:salicylate hydroxylase